MVYSASPAPSTASEISHHMGVEGISPAAAPVSSLFKKEEEDDYEGPPVRTHVHVFGGNVRNRICEHGIRAGAGN